MHILRCLCNSGTTHNATTCPSALREQWYHTQCHHLSLGTDGNSGTTHSATTCPSALMGIVAPHTMPPHVSLRTEGNSGTSHNATTCPSALREQWHHIQCHHLSLRTEGTVAPHTTMPPPVPPH